uniref:Calnexin n=1 Tax=Homo sapiens TaxID=9606 RepID=A0A7P0T8N1_HUMAN
MEGKWLLCMLLVLGTAIVEAHDGHDDDVIDIEDDLDDVIEEVEDSKPDTTAPPSSPKVTYKAPVPTGEVYFADSFDRGTLSGWILSKAKKDDTDDEIAKYDGKWEVEEMKESKLPGDKGLVLMSRAKHHAISAKLNKPFLFDTKPLIVQISSMTRPLIRLCLVQINVERTINCTSSSDTKTPKRVSMKKNMLRGQMQI